MKDIKMEDNIFCYLKISLKIHNNINLLTLINLSCNRCHSIICSVVCKMPKRLQVKTQTTFVPNNKRSHKN